MLRSAASPEYVQRLVSYLESTIGQLRPAGGTEDPTKLALLVALTIADELFRDRDDRAHGDVEAVQRVSELLRLLDEVAPPA